MRTCLAVLVASLPLLASACSPDCSSVCNAGSSCYLRVHPGEAYNPSHNNTCIDQCLKTDCNPQQQARLFDCLDRIQCSSDVGSGLSVVSCVSDSGCGMWAAAWYGN